GLRAELLLAQELPDVGHRRQQPEHADAVGAVAGLEAAEDLALGEQHERHEVEDHQERHQRLEDLDPPLLVVEGVREDDVHGLRTSTSSPSRSPAATNTVPAGTAERTATVARTSPTSTASPSPRPRRSASCGESSACRRGTRNFSAGDASTS